MQAIIDFNFLTTRCYEKVDSDFRGLTKNIHTVTFCLCHPPLEFSGPVILDPSTPVRGSDRAHPWGQPSRPGPSRGPSTEQIKKRPVPTESGLSYQISPNPSRHGQVWNCTRSGKAPILITSRSIPSRHKAWLSPIYSKRTRIFGIILQPQNCILTSIYLTPTTIFPRQIWVTHYKVGTTSTHTT